jgi:hypothetical protein
MVGRADGTPLAAERIGKRSPAWGANNCVIPE